MKRFNQLIDFLFYFGVLVIFLPMVFWSKILSIFNMDDRTRELLTFGVGGALTVATWLYIWSLVS